MAISGFAGVVTAGSYDSFSRLLSLLPPGFFFPGGFFIPVYVHSRDSSM